MSVYNDVLSGKYENRLDYKADRQAYRDNAAIIVAQFNDWCISHDKLAQRIATALDQQVERDAKVADNEGIAWVGDDEAAYGGRIASGEIAAVIRQQVRP